jgi:hypothetical protein
MLRPLLSRWYACAQKLGDVELSVKLLVEMLGHGTKGDSEEPGTLEEDLLAVLKVGLFIAYTKCYVITIGLFVEYRAIIHGHTFNSRPFGIRATM